MLYSDIHVVKGTTQISHKSSCVSNEGRGELSYWDAQTASLHQKRLIKHSMQDYVSENLGKGNKKNYDVCVCLTVSYTCPTVHLVCIQEKYFLHFRFTEYVNCSVKLLSDKYIKLKFYTAA